MNRIVQLSDYEYQQLKNEADMTTAVMDAEIERQIKDKAKLTVELKLDVGNDWEDVFHIRPIVHVRSGYHHTEGKTETVSAVSYSACSKIAKHIEDWMKDSIRKRYKLDVDVVNAYRERMKNQWKWNTTFLLLSLTGWLVALFLIFK